MNLNVLAMVVEFGDRQYRSIIESKSMKRLITILILSACSMAWAYQDMLQLLEQVRSVKSTQGAIEQVQIVQAVKEYQSVESLADLKLWVLEQTQPKIFIEIETADNATDTGYFRIDYRNAGKLGKIGLLREYFNIK